MTTAALVAAAVEGFLLGAGLIVAIGAQNAYVLRVGLLRHHVFAVTTVCALADVLLIGLGVAGIGRFIEAQRDWLSVVALTGAAFLAVYGTLAFRRALRPGVLAPDGAASGGLAAAVLTALALTFLNPHVYLDTVILIGSLSARHDGVVAAAFGAGAATASIVWFYALGFGARVLQPVFARPAAWRVLDGVIGVVMWAIAARLAAEAISWPAAPA